MITKLTKAMASSFRTAFVCEFQDMGKNITD
jgi:hypothetical protein